jgi:iron complex outermembrane receptor protein
MVFPLYFDGHLNHLSENKILPLKLIQVMKYNFILLLLVTFTHVNAQVRGKIVDAVNEEPVADAVIISGSTQTYSGSDGSFSIAAGELISIYATGYQTVNFRTDTLHIQKAGIVITLRSLSHNLSEVSVTAYNSPEKLISVAGAVTVVPVDSLQYGRYNIVSSLAVSPGLIIQEATPGTMKLTLRGIGSRYPYGTKKIKMFFDGIPLYSAEGETYFDDINPENISRMEILRGPSSSIYGASLGGAVILYPEKPEYGYSDLSLISSAGSYGYLKNTLAYASNLGNDNIVISYSNVKSDGYRQNSNYLRNSLFVNFDHRFSDKVKGSLLLMGSAVEAYIPSSLDSSTYISDPQAAAPSWLKTKGNKQPLRILAGYKLKYQPSKNWDILGSLFSTFRVSEENRPFNFLDESGLSYGGRLLARYVKNSGRATYKFTAGSNLFFELYDNSIYENPGGSGVKGNLQQKGSESLYQVDMFSQFELTISKFTFTGGFNINKSGFHFTDLFSADTIDQSGSYNFDPVFSPRISVSWNPVKGIYSYAAINHGFTIPSLSETMTPLGLINRDIKPEKAWSYEAGIRFNFFREMSFIDLALYYMKVDDLIVPRRVQEDFYVGMNAGASLHKGIELSVQQWLWGKRSVGERAPTSAVLNISYSLNSFRFLDFSDGNNNFSGNQLPGIPEHNLAGSFDFKTATGIYSRLEVLSSGRIPLNDFNSGYTEPWLVLNGKAGYAFSFKKRWGADLMLSLNNITNEHYASMVVVNAPGTTAKPPRYYYPGLPFNFAFTIGIKYRFLND